MIISLVTGATGMATKGLKKNVEAVSRRNSVDTLQEIAVIRVRTSHIIRNGQQS